MRKYAQRSRPQVPEDPQRRGNAAAAGEQVRLGATPP